MILEAHLAGMRSTVNLLRLVGDDSGWAETLERAQHHLAADLHGEKRGPRRTPVELTGSRQA